MTKRRTLPTVALFFFMSFAAWAQPGTEGHVNYLEYAQSWFDPFTQAPDGAMQQWFQTHFYEMVGWSPYFDTKTSWFPNTLVYQDLYGILQGSWVQYAHPEWILKDLYGNWLYIPFACNNGTCPMYAGDVANPAFRAWWINQAQTTMASGNYRGIFLDDTNMLFRVSDAWYNQIQPIDSNTGQLMNYDAWRSYIAQFTTEIRTAFPSANILENIIWFAGPNGVNDADPYIQQQIKTATQISLERGIANDPGMTGGTGFWSLYNFFTFVDRVHGLGKGVNLSEYALDPGGQEYGLAGYFMISNGKDSIGDSTATPYNWFSGYSVDLGPALGPRTYTNGVFQRTFQNGMVLLGEPDLAPQTVQLPGWYQRLDGSWVNSVTLSSRQGVILQGGSTAVSSTASAAASTTSGTNHYLSDLSPSWVYNGWGTLQKDRSSFGNPITLNGVQYDKGLGAHAYSEIYYPLSSYGGCSSFTATVGLDDEVAPGVGWAKFQVWADGSLLFDSNFLSGGSPAVPVNLNLTGYQTMSLILTNGIYMAPFSTISWDHGDWANAMITCAN